MQHELLTTEHVARSWAPTLLCAFGFLVNFLPGDAFLAPLWREAGDAASDLNSYVWPMSARQGRTL